MAGQINVNYEKVNEIIDKLYGGFYRFSIPQVNIMLGKRDPNGGLTAGVAKGINGISTRGDAPHFLMQQLECNTAIMLKKMAEEMRAADEAASVK